MRGLGFMVIFQSYNKQFYQLRHPLIIIMKINSKNNQFMQEVKKNELSYVVDVLLLFNFFYEKNFTKDERYLLIKVSTKLKISHYIT